MFAIFAPSHDCLDFHVQTVEVGFKMVEKRMHLIYKGDHWVHRPTQLSKHRAASRQRLAGRSSNHIFYLHTHPCTNVHTHTHVRTHIHTHAHTCTPTNLRCIHIRHSLSIFLKSKVRALRESIEPGRPVLLFSVCRDFYNKH